MHWMRGWKTAPALMAQLHKGATMNRYPKNPTSIAVARSLRDLEKLFGKKPPPEKAKPAGQRVLVKQVDRPNSKRGVAL